MKRIIKSIDEYILFSNQLNSETIEKIILSNIDSTDYSFIYRLTTDYALSFTKLAHNHNIYDFIKKLANENPRLFLIIIIKLCLRKSRIVKGILQKIEFSNINSKFLADMVIKNKCYLITHRPNIEKSHHNVKSINSFLPLLFYGMKNGSAHKFPTKIYLKKLSILFDRECETVYKNILTYKDFLFIVGWLNFINKKENSEIIDYLHCICTEIVDEY